MIFLCYLPAISLQKQSVGWRINLTAGFIPQGCIFYCHTTPWWCSGWLKYKMFNYSEFQFPFKGLDTTRLIGETFLRSVITHVRHFSTRSRSNTTGCSRINNCPCSYSSTEYLSWINDISPKAPNQNIILCRDSIVFFFLCWSSTATTLDFATPVRQLEL